MADDFDPEVLEDEAEAPVVDPDEAAAELAAALAEAEAEAETPEVEVTLEPAEPEAEVAPEPEPDPEPEPEPVEASAERVPCDGCDCEGGECKNAVDVFDPRWEAAGIPLQSREPGADPWGDVPLQSRSL